MENELNLNLIDYYVSRNLSTYDLPFTALIAAAMRKADTFNLKRLEMIFPKIAEDLISRYNSPGGFSERLDLNKFNGDKRNDNDLNSFVESFVVRSQNIANNYLKPQQR